MPLLKLSLTPEDTQRASDYKISNPLLYVLQRETGTLWRLYDDGFLSEVMPPFRASQLPFEILRRCRAYAHEGDATGWETPFEVELELFEPVEPAAEQPAGVAGYVLPEDKLFSTPASTPLSVPLSASPKMP